MARDSSLIYRGLLLLGMMLVLVTLVLFVVFRRGENPPIQERRQPALIAAALPVPNLAFPAAINWGALGTLSDALPDSPGWGVRYNAAIALARIGSHQMPFDVLRQMLDEDLQMRTWVVLTEDGKIITEEHNARSTVLNGLNALTDWHKHPQAVQKVGKDDPGLQRVYAAVDRLTQSRNRVIQQEAESVKQKIASGKW